jgi:tetraprenyl-beta-curcumene synthase
MAFAKKSDTPRHKGTLPSQPLAKPFGVLRLRSLRSLRSSPPGTGDDNTLMKDEISWAVSHVLRSPERLRFLAADGVGLPVRLLSFLRRIVPLASKELAAIRERADLIPDAALRREALASVDGKAYHVAGACILATFLPDEAAKRYIAIVAPLESIYDYLDNLCDRHPEVSIEAYPVLHQAIADALDPSVTPRDYYASGPVGDDGGYLRWLVTRSQDGLRELAGYERLMPSFAEAAGLYGEMQTFKHYAAGERERALMAWYERRGGGSGLEWHEFACAAGSQFQVYAPLYELAAGRPEAIEAAYRAHFPAVAALHVLLDSFIDQAEDREHGELCFAAVYESPERLRERVAYLARDAKRRFGTLPQPARHRFVLRVMALFYLTHPKVYAQGLNRQAEALLRSF